MCHTKKLYLDEFLLVPQLEKNLISIKILCEGNNVYVEFYPNSFFVKDLATNITFFIGGTE